MPTETNSESEHPIQVLNDGQHSFQQAAFLTSGGAMSLSPTVQVTNNITVPRPTYPAVDAQSSSTESSVGSNIPNSESPAAAKTGLWDKIKRRVPTLLKPQSNPSYPGRIVSPEGFIVAKVQDLDVETRDPTKPEVYIRSMLTSGNGLASWQPRPYDGERGTVPGDVGTFNAVGGFRKVFNLWEDAESLRCAQMCYKPPKMNILPLTRALSPSGPIMDGTSAHTEYTADGNISSFQFKMAAARGAVLVSTSPADLEELDDYAKLKNFIIQHARLLYQHANVLRELDDDQSLYIVTGCIKSASWAMAVFKEPMAPPHDVLRLVKRGGSSSIPIYAWTSRGTALAKSYPDEDHDDYSGKEKNQTLFMHGFKLSFSPAFRSRVNKQSIPRDTDSSKPSRDPDFSDDGGRRDGGDDTNGGSSSNRRDEGGSFSGNGPKSSFGQVLSGGVSIQPFPNRSDTEITLHPLDGTNRQLLRLTNADFALTHDDDWRFALQGKTLDDVDSFNALRTSNISVSNGVAFLVNSEPQMQDLATQISTFNVEDFQQNSSELDPRRLDPLPKRPDTSKERPEHLPDSRKPDVDLDDSFDASWARNISVSNADSWRSNILASRASQFFVSNDVAISANALSAPQISIFNVEGLQQNAPDLDLLSLDLPPAQPDMSNVRLDYLPDSRKPDIDNICERESSSADLVLCVHGPAGIGKTTLAGHLSDKFRSAGRLAASVFLDTIRTGTSDPQTIIKMIAREIGCIHPRAIPRIVEAMNECHATSSLESHIQKYIVEPLRSLDQPQPLIIIMDAMDEWQDHLAFIEALALLNSQSSVVKFILTHRLNPCAYHFPFPGIDKVSIYTYALGPFSHDVMEAYFHKHLAMVPWVDGRKASSADVQKLIELSGGLPVWASSVITLLSHQLTESPPHEILADIVEGRMQVGNTDGLGAMYCNVLTRLFPSPGLQKYLRRYMEAITGLQEPLQMEDFLALTKIPYDVISKIQFSFPALQIRSPPPPPGSQWMVYPATTLLHNSLLEYIQAPTAESSFAVSVFDSHSMIGSACLKKLLVLPPSSARSNSRHFGIQRYAVKYWPHHVFHGSPRSNEQWSRTEHCSILKMVPHALPQWAALFLEEVAPGEDGSKMEDVRDESMVTTLKKLADVLGKSDGDHWRFQVACLEVAIRLDGADAEAWTELGRCYRQSGIRTSDLRMYEEAVVAFRQALNLRPDPHPSRGESLDDVSGALRSCHELNGDVSILNEAILCSRQAIVLHPVPHPDLPASLNNLARALQSLYDHNGAAGALEEAISLYHETLRLLPASHPDRPASLRLLAKACVSRSRGTMKDLDEAISLRREVLVLCPPGHSRREADVGDLVRLLEFRFQRTGDDRENGEIQDLKEELAALKMEALSGST